MDTTLYKNEILRLCENAIRTVMEKEKEDNTEYPDEYLEFYDILEILTEEKEVKND